MIIKKTPETVEKFITMYCMGEKMTDIAKVLNVSRPALYEWLATDEDIKAEIERRRQECKDAGNEYIKSRYLQYLKNISNLATQTDDKRTSLAANEFLIEKMDGKNRTMLDVSVAKDKDNVDDDVINDVLNENGKVDNENVD